jgi:L-threonylcarbamoyladenylate synthase
VKARILEAGDGLEEAVQLLACGGIVGLPTETVYGLAGDAFNPDAVARIFEAKLRPLSDPLIVHLPKADWLERVASFDSLAQRRLVEKLAAAFWPGPLTLLLPKRADLPDLVTAGSPQVAVRVTSHACFQEVLIRLDSPIASPSANRFGSISPTSAEDVRLELGESIELILDGGPCFHGVESTIVRFKEEEMSILRPGPIAIDQLKQYGHVFSGLENVNSPGSLPGHYAPKKELQIIDTDISSDSTAAFLAFRQPRYGYASLEILSPGGDLRKAAANLYGALRRLDQGPAVKIYAEPVPEEGIGVAIMDRLRRASYGSKNRTGHFPTAGAL